MNQVCQITFNSLFGALIAWFILPTAVALASPQSNENNVDLERVFDLLSEHTRVGFTSDEWHELLRLRPGSSLIRLREPFESAFQATDLDINSVSSTGATFTYMTGRSRPDLSSGLMPHTFVFGRPNSFSKYSDSQKELIYNYEKTIFQKSSYFLVSTGGYDVANKYLLAPLRIDDGLIIMAASMGSELDPSDWVYNLKDSIPGPRRTPRKLVLVIGVRTDELDIPKELNINTKEVIQYQLRIASMNQDELTAARQEQLEQIPGVSELVRNNSAYRTLNINHLRLNLNLASRDMRGEARDLIKRAAADLPGFQKKAVEMFDLGGFGVLQTRDGKQYLVQSLMIPVDDSSYNNSQISNFARALMDNKLQIRKKILLPPDFKKGRAVLKKMKRDRSAWDTQDALSAARRSSSSSEQQEASVVMGELLKRLGLRGGPSNCVSDLE